MPSPATIAIVIVNWNGWRMTLQCLAALRACRVDGFDWHAYVVDNDSSDDSLEQLADLGTGATLVRSPVNGGWTGGNNLGVDHALAGGHSFVFLLNNDAIIEPGALLELMRAHEERAAERPILGCMQLTDDGKGMTFSTIGLDPRTCLLYDLPAIRKDALLQQRFIPTSVVNGAALFARRSVFLDVGRFDERFYLNYDESDWCIRATVAGHTLYTLRDAVIFHSGNKSIGGAASPLQQYFMFRNLFLFMEMHATPLQRVRAMRRVVSSIRDVTGRESWLKSIREFFSSSPVVSAIRAGLRDYLLRRFGNCPDAIRQLHR